MDPLYRGGCQGLEQRSGYPKGTQAGRAEPVQPRSASASCNTLSPKVSLKDQVPWVRERSVRDHVNSKRNLGVILLGSNSRYNPETWNFGRA